jgi:tetratricopeptide (TPR) repeat protein
MKRKSNNNIARINWLFLVPQVVIFLILSIVLKELDVKQYWLLSLSIYLLLNGYLKVIVPKWHRKGLFYVKKGEFEGAVYAFQTSYDFFNKYNWVDKYRAITLLSVSGYAYREMALMNMIYCYQQLGKNMEAKKVQEKLAIEYPNNIYGHKK